jgi:hypothetical protein
MAKYGGRINKAAKAAAHAEIRLGMPRVPPGITKGVAKLTGMEMATIEDGKQNAGETYYRATAVCIEPEYVLVGGVKTKAAGCQTSVIETIADTKTSRGKPVSVEEHTRNWFQFLRLLGAPEEELEQGGEAAESWMAAAVSEGAPAVYFEFSTRLREGRWVVDEKTKEKTKEPDGVWEDWGYAIKGYVPPDPTKVAAYDSAARAQPNGQAQDQEQDRGQEYDHNQEDNPPSEAEDGDNALLELVEKAKGKANYKESQGKLTQLALARGWTQQQVDDVKDWNDVIPMIKAGPQGNGKAAGKTAAEPPADEEDWEPKTGDTCLMTRVDGDGNPARDPRTKRPLRPLQVKVKTVHKDHTATCLDGNDGKTEYKKVLFQNLTPV